MASVSNNTHNAVPHKGSLPTAMGRASWTLEASSVCVCQGEWEDALLSSASVLLLSRVVQLHTLSPSLSLSHTHKDRHTAHEDSHAWNIVCIKYLMRCVRLSGVVLPLGESSCRIQWAILSCVTSPEPQCRDSAQRNESPTTCSYTLLYIHTLQPTIVYDIQMITKCFILFKIWTHTVQHNPLPLWLSALFLLK